MRANRRHLSPSKTTSGEQTTLMLKILPASLLLASIATAQDELSLKALTQKNLDKEIARALTPGELGKKLGPLLQIQSLKLDSGISQCAIPLKEMRASGNIDPIAAKSLGPAKPFDAIARRAPIQACRDSVINPKNLIDFRLEPRPR